MPKPRGRKDFVFIETGLPRNPKLKSIGDAKALALWVVGTCYAGEHRTDGHVPQKIVEREALVTARISKKLIDVGLWHVSGHACDRCPQPEKGSVYIHDYLDHQPSRADRDKARDDAEAAAAARWSKASKDAKGNAKGIAPDHAKGIPIGNAIAMPSQSQRESKSLTDSLIAIVCRRLSGDARATTTDEEVAIWRETAGGADLETELKAWIMHNAGTDLRDPGAALLGWLRRAAVRAAEAHRAAGVHPDADTRPPEGCGAPGCAEGWMGFDEDERPIPCPTCRPRRLRTVAS